MISRIKDLNCELSRRTVMQTIAGLSLGVNFSMTNTFAEAKTPAGKRKKVVRIFLPGGASQLDTFDPKPQSPELMGDTKVIKTNTGEEIAEHLPMMAQRMDKIALVRSMRSTEADHGRGRYLMQTSYVPLGTIKHPNFGAWMQALNGTQNKALPASVHIKSAGSAGFLGSEYDPFQVSAPSDPLKGLVMKNPKSDRSIELLKLMGDVRREFHNEYKFENVNSYAQYYNDSIKLMHSEDLKAFDLNQEDKKGRAKYNFSQGNSFLLARRLLEADVQYVALSIGDWDDHGNIWEGEGFKNKVNNFDRALATFLDDLYERGMYEDVIVSVSSEFGRTPKINSRKGRDHHRGAFFGILAGAGVKNGLIYGKSDDQANRVVENPVSPKEFNATLAHLAGLNLDKEIYSPDNRPFTVSRGAKAVSDLVI